MAGAAPEAYEPLIAEGVIEVGRSGIALLGEAASLLERGELGHEGRRPVNLSGGLLSCGEALGRASRFFRPRPTREERAQP